MSALGYLSLYSTSTQYVTDVNWIGNWFGAKLSSIKHAIVTPSIEMPFEWVNPKKKKSLLINYTQFCYCNWYGAFLFVILFQPFSSCFPSINSILSLCVHNVNFNSKCVDSNVSHLQYCGFISGLANYEWEFFNKMLQVYSLFPMASFCFL